MQAHLIDLTVDAEQKRIARRLGDQEVEFTVPSRESFLVVGRGLGVRQNDLHVVADCGRVACSTASRVVKGSTARRASISCKGLI